MCAIYHLLMANTVAVWTGHCHGPPGQGLHLRMGFLHYIGLLIWIFEDWLVIAKHNAEYCQPFIIFNKSDLSSQAHKTGHVFAIDQSATQLFEAEFVDWDINLQQIFSPQSINSFGY